MDEATRPSAGAGEDVDLDASLCRPTSSSPPPRSDPGIRAATIGYLRMTALPSSLRAVEPRARALYADGWRPAYSPGPGRQELAEIVARAVTEPQRV